MRLRENQQVTIDSEWEKYDVLSKRQIIRKSPACRVNVTMFAAKRSENHLSSVASPMPEISQGDGNVPGIPSSNPDMSPPEEEHSRRSLETTNDEDNSPSIDAPAEQHDVGQSPPSVVQEVPKGNQLPAGNAVPASSESAGHDKHGPRFRALPKEEQAMIKRAHQNLCHPNPEQLSAVFRAQGCRPEISQAVFDMKCPTCAACQKPKISRPSTLKDALDFNDKVFIDGISWTSKNGNMFHFYHLLDQATNYHVAIPAPSRSAEQAIAKVSEAWFQWAGPPNKLITDPATEFTSEAFEEFLQRHDVKSITTSPHAHWQNGRCERHGRILQTMLDKLDHENPITTFKELRSGMSSSDQTGPTRI
eukprot:s1016_g11.t2